ncbi:MULTISPECIES: sugar phosphorylase [unclassified Enterococcus]|uniref:sugar phosphorylase n=1 Tax=unclassified Enterococcus TaxID=2608891 RepID=UPI001E3781B0|nr:MULTISPECIES: sugar phosphorylase [unclassified Enterococcus]MCB5955991.1 sugar phosphorylase [Enterococcus sp. CWB-B31]
MIDMNKIQSYLSKLYSGNKLAIAEEEFRKMLEGFSTSSFVEREPLSERSVYLITYGDSFLSENQKPLQVLKEVIDRTLSDTITDVHLLPMFPFTSDDGFSVVDYDQINPDLGDWTDIEELAKNKRLMFDFVANHMSKDSLWFKNYLNRKPGFDEAFVACQSDFDTTKVVRPRTSPLFHEYKNTQGELVSAWTTFSEDQVDVNVKDPIMLVRLTKVLLNYAQKGAASIRLDAIGFLWKESGTVCMHLPQTHTIVQLWNYLLSKLTPNTQIITETNVPHKDNISYFGDTENEANQVYQFPLPPLVLHSFINRNSIKLSEWAKTIDKVSETATYFNFLASHDGIGLRPTEGILSDEERQKLVNRVLQNKGKVSYKSNADGTQSVYEMNINYSSALSDETEPEMTPQKMIAAHHILLSVVGVPAIYSHSIFGSKNDLEGLEKSGINRRINREKLQKNVLFAELKEDAYRKAIYEGITKLIRIRADEEAFNPYNPQEVLDISKQVFCLKRIGKTSDITCLTNLSNHEVMVEGVKGKNLITGTEVNGGFLLPPYGCAWLKEEK